MTYAVVLRSEAQAQIDEIDAWWRVNRADSPSRFATELVDALAQLSVAPLPAPRWRRDIHRIRLKVTRNHVYFRVDEDARVVHVLAVWGGPRRRGPPLPR